VLASVAAVGRGEGGSGWERRPESAASAALAEAVAESARYASQYQSFCMRAAVLAHELADTRAALDAARARTATADAVARHLAAERAAADERARAAAAEAAMLARQECEQRAKADGLCALEAELDGQLDLLARTLQPLRLEADKARLLALQLNPAANLDDGTADAPRNALAQPRPNPG
jgi:chromosome segregation ATPase